MRLRVEIEKRYGRFLLQADFTAESGQALGLLGASGCGKSVTLRCIAGVHRPDRGRVELDGRVLFDSAAGIDLPPQQRQVGLLFQNCALFPTMTVEGNIGVCLRRLPKGERKRRTGELLALLRLEDQARLYPRQLSGGQSQRAALARILASEPRAILLDEPFSALDSYLKWQLEEALQELLECFPGPVLWVSHDRGEVFRHCPRVCVLEEGRSAPVRDTGALLEDPRTVSAARLSGWQNFVQAVPEGDLVRLPDWGLTLRAAAPRREGCATLGFQASRVHPAQAREENAFPCRVLRVTEDLAGLRVTLLPTAAREGAPTLQMEAAKGLWLPGADRVRVAIRPEDLIFLE